MDTQTRPTRTRSFAELLHMSESFLRKREFNSCYKYAVKAKESDPHHPAVGQLIAISVTLMRNRSPNRPDWYKFLSLQSNVEQSEIQNRVDVLKNLLNPSENPYPYADEALDCVLKAGSVLCDPIRRAHFDNSGDTFWTRCPFCYYLFEYEKLFENRCMKCQNESCRRAYTAVPIGEKAAPSPEVLEKGEYVCTGLGSEEGSGYNGENLKHQASQTSTGVGSGQHADPKANGGAHGEEKNGVFIEISDNEDEVKSQDVQKVVGEEANNGGRVVTKRRKVMARSTKKVMGRGVRVNMDEVVMKQQIEEDFGMEQEKKDDSVEFTGASSSKGNLDDDDVKLQFVDGDDDIFVGLDADFWQC